MATHGNAPIIIKRKKVISGGGHHGGAWKVAYADFVTAMMAFFMLMWLLGATTEDQRKGLSDYFSPSIPITRDSGGGDGLFGGNSMFTTEAMHEETIGAVEGEIVELASAGSGVASEVDAAAAELAAFRDLEEVLLGQGGESMLSEQALRHVLTRLTDEGLIIEIFSLPDASLFAGQTADPMPVTREIVDMIARAAALVTNKVAVAAYVPSQTVVLAENPVWNMSSDRAMATRLMLEDGGLDPARMQRVTGHADRLPIDQNPTAVRNDRIEITLLRLVP